MVIARVEVHYEGLSRENLYSVSSSIIYMILHITDNNQTGSLLSDILAEIGL